jgi:hypothetical protein
MKVDTSLSASIPLLRVLPTCGALDITGQMNSLSEDSSALGPAGDLVGPLLLMGEEQPGPVRAQ